MRSPSIRIWSKVAVVVVHRDDIAACDQDFSTFARAFLSRLGTTRTEARETGEARRRRKTRGRNSSEKSAPIGPPMAHAAARTRMTCRYLLIIVSAHNFPPCFAGDILCASRGVRDAGQLHLACQIPIKALAGAPKQRKYRS
jgi:hypothetical protein